MLIVALLIARVESQAFFLFPPSEAQKGHFFLRHGGFSTALAIVFFNLLLNLLLNLLVFLLSYFQGFIFAMVSLARAVNLFVKVGD